MTAPQSKKTANLYDTRVLQRNLADGSLDQKEFDNHLANLPDVSNKAQPFDTGLGAHEDADGMDEEGDEGEG